ncbi:MAG: DUF4956 domain-containing protein [Planctomycetota bacterium]|nr:DUF4956 domain-containing protein [Planctomycetota bacterium]
MLEQLLASGPNGIDLQALLLSLVVAFILGQLLAWTYSWTHAGLSYSSSFTQSLVLISVSATMVMFVIGSSLVTAFGLLGALAMIRFRNNLKDTRDTVFVFFSLIVGMAIGTQRLPAGVLATVFFCLGVAFLSFTSFGARNLFDGHLRCRLQNGEEGSLTKTLKEYCIKYRQVSASHDATSIEFVYEVLLRDRSNGSDFVQELKRNTAIEDAGLVVRDGAQES